VVAIREILNRAQRDMDLLFESIYDERGRYPVPPEWLLRGLVLANAVRDSQREAVVRATGLQHTVLNSPGFSGGSWL